MTSATTITTTTVQKSGGLALPLCIFLTLLAVNTEARMRQRVQTLVRNILSAIVAFAESLGRPVEPAKGLVQVPEETPLLAGEKERLLPLHRVGALISHVERIGAQIAVCSLRGRAEGLVVVSELFQHALPIVEETLLEMIEHLLGHRLLLLDCNGCRHLNRPFECDAHRLAVNVNRLHRVMWFL